MIGNTDAYRLDASCHYQYCKRNLVTQGFVAKESEHHRQFLESYYGGDWKEALNRLDTAKDFHDDMTDYYSNMKTRIKAGKPKDWDGTYKATSK